MKKLALSTTKTYCLYTRLSVNDVWELLTFSQNKNEIVKKFNLFKNNVCIVLDTSVNIKKNIEVNDTYCTHIK